MEKLACSKAEAAKALGVTVPTIGSWINNGTLHAEKIGGRVLISIKEVHRLMRIDHEPLVDVRAEYFKQFAKLTPEEKLKEIEQLFRKNAIE